MPKFIKLAEYLDCRTGKSLEECAIYFNVSKRSVQRWIEQIEIAFSSLKVEQSWDPTGVKRFRCVGRTRLQKAQLYPRDVLEVWSMTLAMQLLAQKSLDEDAAAVSFVRDRLMQSLPLAVRLKLEAQIAMLQLNEFASHPPYRSSSGNFGLLGKLRLALLEARKIKVTLRDGSMFEAFVKCVVHDDCVNVIFLIGDFEKSVALAKISAVVGIHDMLGVYVPLAE